MAALLQRSKKLTHLQQLSDLKVPARQSQPQLEAIVSSDPEDADSDSGNENGTDGHASSDYFTGENQVLPNVNSRPSRPRHRVVRACQ